MKHKHAILCLFVILMLTSVIAAPTEKTTESFSADAMDARAPVALNRLAADEQLEPLKVNVNKNPSFEDWDGTRPASYDGVMVSEYGSAEFDYSGVGVTGNYGLLMEAESSTEDAAFHQVIQSVPTSPSPLIEPGMSLTLDWNTIDNPVINEGGKVFVEVNTWDGGSKYRNLFYVLSGNTASSNGTREAYFYMNDTIDQWNSFDRNITSDYIAVWGEGDLSATQYVQYVRLRIYSNAGIVGIVRAAFDNVVLTNGSYAAWIGNGNFETGSQSPWWATRSSKAYLEQSTDSTHETYSMNMSVPEYQSGTGSVNVMKNFDFPGGYFASSPDMMYLELDWKYNDTPSIPSMQYAELGLTFRNATGLFYLYIQFGSMSDILTGTNTTNANYFEMPGFGNKDLWQHTRIDMNDYLNSVGYSNVSLYELRFFLSNSADGASVFLLVDDFQIITYPLGDPGFEEDWYMDSRTPFAGWDDYNGDITEIQRTNDALVGDHACNLTAEGPVFVGVYREVGVPLHPSDLTNFSWRLDEIGSGGSFAYIRIHFDTYGLDYILAAGSTFSITNASTAHDIIVDRFNTTGSWNQLNVNLTADFEEAFGFSHGVSITEIYLRIGSDSGNRTSILFDEMHFVDGASPVIDSIAFSPTSPMYYDDVEVDVYAHDDRTGMGEVFVDYYNGTEWTTTPASDMGSFYQAVIPSYSYMTTILFQVTAIDNGGMSVLDDNGGIWYYYTIGDDIGPTVTINSPADATEMEGMAIIETTVDDESGSGIDYVEFRVGQSLFHTDDTAPYSSVLNLNVLNLGVHTINATVYDVAGNYASDTISITVVDTTTPTIDSPADVSFDEGEVGQWIAWSPDDARPSSYEVLLDGASQYSGLWNSTSEFVNISLDSLAFGEYNYTCVVYDDAGLWNADTVIVTVVDAEVPIVDLPASIQYIEFSTGHSIIWSPADDHPDSYSIYRNGSLVHSGLWNSSSETITVSVDNLGLGVHNYTIVVTDIGSNSAASTVWVTVVDGTSPTIDSPSDVEYTEGETGHEIEWTPFDHHPLSYIILLDGETARSGSWDNASLPISISVDGLGEGVYNYTISVEDVAGNKASDTVIVTVNAESSSTTTGTSTTTSTTTTTTTIPPPEGLSPMTLMIAGVSGVVVIAVIIVAMRKRPGS
ncbi:hypothetical protein EU537_03010 [Candidatus Thorarchaeota archaeon]|nr:MAG: hypothetical protein EU537_03010 [Candidatus Thorarchaeota archaeon]